MPNYLQGEQNSWAALGGMGDQFSNAVLQLQQQKMAGYKWQQEQQMARQQMAMDAAKFRQQGQYQQDVLGQGQQRLGMEQSQWSEGAPGRKATTDLHVAEAMRAQAQAQQMQQLSQAGGVLGDVFKNMYQTDPTKNPDTYAMLRAIAAQQQARIAQDAPGSIVKQMNELQISRDPRMQQHLALGTPQFQTLSPGSQMLDLYGPKPEVVAQAPVRPGLSMEDRIQLLQESLLGRAAIDRYGTPEENVGNVKKALGTMDKAVAPQGTTPITAVNPQTKQRIQSTDGGKTWSPIQ